MSFRLTTPPDLSMCKRGNTRSLDARKLGSDLRKEGTQGVAGHLSSQSGLSLGSCNDCPLALGAAGPLGRHNHVTPESPARRHGQRRESAATCRVSVQESPRASVPVAEAVGDGCLRAAPGPSSRRGSSALGPLLRPPAPRLASFLSPSLLPSCGQRGQNGAAAHGPRTARATTAATSPVGAGVARGCAALVGGQKKLLSEGGCGDSCATETFCDLQDGSGNSAPPPYPSI